MFMNLTQQRGATAVLLALATVIFASPLFAAAPAIDDNGGFFSKSALLQSNRIVERIYEQTKPHKDIVVETFESLPSGVGSADELANQIFRDRDVDGIVIVAVKQPGRLRVAVGRQTQSRFTSTDRNHLVEIMLGDFRKKNFDQGLLGGLGFARQKLTEAFPAVGGSSARQPEPDASGSKGAAEVNARERQASGGLPTWAWALLICGGVWVIFALFRAGSQPPSQGAGSSSPSSYGAGSYAGGWGRSILGGMFGAMAGEWLYDRFARGGGEAYGAREEPMDRSYSGSNSDDGQVGGVGGGDFSDSNDTSNLGFDDRDGGDFGGGDDSGGGDF
jgi:uncharacterized protein